MDKYIVITYSCCSEHGGTEIYYYNTEKEARENASTGDTVAKLIVEVV